MHTLRVDRTSPDEMTSPDPGSNDNNNGKTSSSDNRDLSRNGGGGGIIKKGESDHSGGGGSLQHHSGGHHQTQSGQQHQQHHSSPAPAPLDRSYSSQTHLSGQQQQQQEQEDLPGGNAQYLSANCVIFTYFDKNISDVVNEHFTRALSQGDSSTVGGSLGGNTSSSPPSIETEKSKGKDRTV